MTARKIALYAIAIVGMVLAAIVIALKVLPSRTELQVDYSEQYYQLIKKGTLTEEERAYIMREEERVHRDAITAYEKQKARQVRR